MILKTILEGGIQVRTLAGRISSATVEPRNFKRTFIVCISNEFKQNNYNEPEGFYFCGEELPADINGQQMHLTEYCNSEEVILKQYLLICFSNHPKEFIFEANN